MADDISKGVFNDLMQQTAQLQINKINELKQVLDDLQKKQREISGSWKRYTDEYENGNKAIINTEKALKNVNGEIAKNTEILKLAKGSLQQNKQLLEDLLTKYNALSGSQGDNSQQVKSLNVQIGHLSKTIDDQEKKLSKSREVFDFYKGSVDALKGSFEKVKNSAGQFAPQLEDAAKGFNFLKDGLAAAKTGFQSVGGAIKASGFGLLVLVLQSLVEYFTKTTEGGKILSGMLAVVGQVVDKINGYFASMGGIIVKAVTHPLDSIKAIGTFIKENLINRVKAFSVILDGIMHLDFKKIGDGIIQAGTGVTNATDKIKGAYQQTKKAVIETGNAIVKTYQEGTTAKEKQEAAQKEEEKARIKQQQAKEERDRKNLLAGQKSQQANDKRLADAAQMAEAIFQQYAKEITDTEAHFKALAEKYKKSKDKLLQIEKDKTKAFSDIAKKFQTEDLAKLNEYEHQLEQIKVDSITDAKQKALAQLELDKKDKLVMMAAEDKKVQEKINQHQKDIQTLKAKGKAEEIKILEDSIKIEEQILNKSLEIRTAYIAEQDKKKNEITATSNNSPAAVSVNQEGANSDNTAQEIDKAEQSGQHSKALELQINQLKQQYDIAVKAATDKGEATTKIEGDYAKKKAALEDQLTTSRIHAGDKFINAALKTGKKDSAIFKAAFLAKKATAIADTIISTKSAVMDSLKAYSGIPFIGQALGIVQAAFMAAQGASSIAEIAKQKPGFAAGGQFKSDGRGALLPGYSRTDNTNAYLRSGEAVVVSEAMRNPWARNLVSAINVAHGGRDFSIANPGSGYAIGGIFTDGGNSNRYYSQPMNDQKDLANTIAYQMINNFPPVYVDVKDINTQQNILARTVDRVNL